MKQVILCVLGIAVFLMTRNAAFAAHQSPSPPVVKGSKAVGPPDRATGASPLAHKAAKDAPVKEGGPSAG